MSYKNRIWYIDFFRGLAIVNMIIYHSLYDLRYVFNVPWAKFFSMEGFHFYQQYICISFIFIAGISTNFSKNVIRKGLLLIFFNLVIHFVTTLISEDLAIRYGVLGLIGTGMIFIELFVKKLRINIFFGFLIFITLFIFAKYSIFSQNFVYNSLNELFVNFDFGYIFGFPKPDFYSADYFPIYPWIFLISSGYYFGKNILGFEVNKRAVIKNSIVKIISKIGQKSLAIYLLHQPVVALVLFIFYHKKL